MCCISIYVKAATFVNIVDQNFDITLAPLFSCYGSPSDCWERNHQNFSYFSCFFFFGKAVIAFILGHLFKGICTVNSHWRQRCMSLRIKQEAYLLSRIIKTLFLSVAKVQQAYCPLLKIWVPRALASFLLCNPPCLQDYQVFVSPCKNWDLEN